MNQQETELVLNSDGSVYHLSVKGDQLADTIILVGDPARADRVAARFDSLTFSGHNREFHTRTGIIGGRPISVVSTGIGTDNIDIVVTEIDAAVNIDPVTRKPYSKKRRLNLIRLGTCGALHADIDVDAVVLSQGVVGLDGVAHFYDTPETEVEKQVASDLMTHFNWPERWNQPYVRFASPALSEAFAHVKHRGITLTSNGFFGPQGRAIRIPLAQPDMNERLRSFSAEGLRISNYEMECSALYALGQALDHRCLTMCVVVANRYAGRFSKDYQTAVESMIDMCLAELPKLP